MTTTILRLIVQTVIAVWLIYTEWGNYLAWAGLIILVPTLGSAHIAYKKGKLKERVPK